MIKACAGCGVNFETNGTNARFCTKVCRMGQWKEKTLSASSHACGVCAKLFTSLTKSTRNCSKECVAIARTKRCAISCAKCGVSFAPKHDAQLLCSDKCNRDARRGKPIAAKTGQDVACAACGKVTYFPKHRVLKGVSNKFCSTSCNNEFQKRFKVECKCLVCGVGFSVSPTYASRKYCSVKCRDACPEFKRNCWIENNLQLQKRKQPTSLEVAGRLILDRCGFEFLEQVLIANKFTVDALVAGKLIVQWDGDYWHGYRAIGDLRPLDTRQARRAMLDKSQDAYMAKAGFTVLRFWEHEVKDAPDAVVHRITETISSMVEHS